MPHQNVHSTMDSLIQVAASPVAVATTAATSVTWPIWAVTLSAAAQLALPILGCALIGFQIWAIVVKLRRR
jgi:hypothetical protein